MPVNHACPIDGDDCSLPDRGMIAGHCQRHHLMLLRTGKVLGTGRAANGRPMAFVEAALVSATDDCIEWPYGKCAGYGIVVIQGAKVRAHRLVLERTQGPAPEPRMDAAHAPGTCHNRSCINPRHLRWATRAENSQDKVIDGTHNRGVQSPLAILTDEQVVAIRRDPRSDYDVSVVYGVSTAAIGDIKRFRRWCHIPWDSPIPIRASKRPRRSLDADDVAAIRRRAITERGVDLANEYGVAQATICDIVKRRTWKHLP